MSITCIKFNPVNKGALVGYATIFVEKWGLEIPSCGLFSKDGKEWMTLPQRAYEKDGKTAYSSYLRFKDDNIYKKFMEIALKAIKEKSKESVSKEPEMTLDDNEEVPF